MADVVVEMQSQLRGLERANRFATATASAHWSLSAVLQTITDSARDLLDARYAALVVLEGDDRVVNFVGSGMDNNALQQMSALRHGQDILDVLIRDPASPYLWVPIQMGGEALGHLYLTEPSNGVGFSSEDQTLATVMSITAGGAIANAQRLAESEQRRRWLVAATKLSNHLLVDQSDEPLEVITDAAAVAADADVVTLTVPEGDGTISSRAASGPLAGALKARSWPAVGTLDDQVIRTGTPMLVDQYPTAAAFGADIGPTMVLPLVAGDEVRGAMSLSRAASRPAFTPAELDMAATFANQATLAMALIDARAAQVLEMKSQVRGLERAKAFAAATATAQWSLPAVLQAITDSARDLLDARGAALVVIKEDDRVAALVHSGMDPVTVEHLGALLRGQDVLNVLTAAPYAFLGVPIRVGGDAFGHLYVTEPISYSGEFTSEDESLATVMAITASGAIANAQRLAESEQRKRWLDAAKLSNRLLVGQADEPLEVIANAAAAAADADVVTLTVPEGDNTISSRAVGGPLARTLQGTNWPAAGTLADQVMQDGKPVLVDQLPTAPAFSRGIGPTMVLPLIAGDGVRGAISLCRATDRPAFTLAELDMAATFANQAALAMELIDTRADHVSRAVFENKERIAEDLHDHVIQELFATGMSLQGLIGRLDRPEHQQRVTSAVESLDDVVSRIRTAIFHLGPQPGEADGAGLKAAILAVATEHTAQLGYSPHVQFGGFLDSAVAAELSDDILAVTREALSNCARHAGATTVTISLEATDQLITLEITDDGRGIGQPERSSGLTNMRRRAEHQHGTLTVTTPDGGGTRLSWTARRL